LTRCLLTDDPVAVAKEAPGFVIVNGAAVREMI
jgi:hypothetical protein